jgi:uncharacterized phage protein (TIGR02218 family)
MSFDARETSEFEGEPQELYWFMRGSDEWLYTSGAFQITLGDETYEPLAGLKRADIVRGQERGTNQLTIEMPRSTDIAEEFISVPKQSAIWLKIFRVHDGETDYRIFYQGRIRAVDFKGNIATLTLDDITASIHKQAFRWKFQNQCNNFTFDANCTLDEEDFTYANQEILSIDGNDITFDNTEASAWFTSGQIVMSTGDRRMIVNDVKVGSTHTITLLQPFETLIVGDLVDAVGGACRHTFATCQAVKTKSGGTEDNSENYGGYPLVPRKDPFRSIV